MRRSQPADRAQRDDEEIRPRRVDAESIATAIPVVIDGRRGRRDALWAALLL